MTFQVFFRCTARKLAVMRSNSAGLSNLSEIELSAAELLRFKNVEYGRSSPSCI